MSKYRIAEVIFAGNHAKKYSFFAEDFLDVDGNPISSACCRVGDMCVCDTRSGLSVGEVVGIKEFKDRPNECNKFILWYHSKKEIEFLTNKYHPGQVKKIIEADKEDDDLDFLNDVKGEEDALSFLDDL